MLDNSSMRIILESPILKYVTTLLTTFLGILLHFEIVSG